MINGLKIICTQPFFNELDLLDIKLNTLKDVVDVFVIVEATRTFSGIAKPLWFNENKERYKDFPIEHVIVTDLPAGTDPWAKERHQHQRIYETAMRVGFDVVIWGDLDEIMSPESVHEFVASGRPVMGYEQDWLRYFFNREHNQKWKFRCISRDKVHRQGCSPDQPTLHNAGWHFNYCTDKPTLLDKINATSHAVEAGTLGFWNDVRSGLRPQLDLTTLYPESKLPPYIVQNKERFKSQFWQEGQPLT